AIASSSAMPSIPISSQGFLPMTSSKPTVLVTRKLPQAVEARLERDFVAHLNRDDHAMPKDGILAKAEGCSGLLITPAEQFTPAVIAALPRSVRILATFSVGHDHIDLQAAKAHGLTVTNTPEVLTDATADIAMLLILGAARGASWGERMVREGRWTSWSPTAPLGSDVTGKTLGIIGMGRIGQALAQRARGFDMPIHYFNRSRVPPENEFGAT